MKKQSEISQKFKVEISLEKDVYTIVSDTPLWEHSYDNVYELNELGAAIESEVMLANPSLDGFLLGSTIDPTNTKVVHLPIRNTND